MFPIRDKNPTRTTPYLTWTLIALNVLAFLYEASVLEAGYVAFVSDWGFVPARFLASPANDAITLLTSMFLHGGWLHLGGNMLFLWIFGDNVEDRLGRGRFLLFYVASGLVAAFAQMLIDPRSAIPMVGASGAIAGVLGAYLTFFPHARVVVVFPIFIFLQFFELPAWLVIVEWFVLQLLSGLTSLALPAATGGVAFFAHIGGFVAGIVGARLLRGREPPRRGGLDEWRPPSPFVRDDRRYRDWRGS